MQDFGPRFVKNDFKIRKLDIANLLLAPKGLWRLLQEETGGRFKFKPTDMRLILDKLAAMMASWQLSGQQLENWSNTMSKRLCNGGRSIAFNKF